MVASSRKNYDFGGEAGAEREYAWEAAVHGVSVLSAIREFLGESVLAVPGEEEDDSWEGAGDEEDEAALNRRAAKQAAQDLLSSDFEVRWDACRDLGKLQQAAAPHMQALAELIERETEFDVKRVAKKTLRELEKADKAGWPNPPVRPDRFQAVAGQDAVGALEAAGVPVQRLRSVEVAKRLALKLRRLKKLDLPSLERDYTKLGVPLEPNMGKQQLVERLGQVTLWSELELQELESECRERQVSERTDADDDTGQRCELVSRLLHEECRRAWQAQGVPVERFATFRAAAALVERLAALQRKPDEALGRECTDRGFPMEADVGRAELLSRLGALTLWEALPTDELQSECRRLGRLSGVLPTRLAFTEQLLLAHCAAAFEARGVPLLRLGSLRAGVRLSEALARLEAMGSVELDLEFCKLGLLLVPRQRKDQLHCLRSATTWDMLSVSELSQEWSWCCARLRERGISSASSAGSGGEVEERKHLKELLLLSLCVDAWEGMQLPVARCGSLQKAAKVAERWVRFEEMGAEELAEEAASQGLSLPGVAPAELLGRLRTVAAWAEMPAQELRKECEAFGVGANQMPSDRDLLKRLIKAAKEQWLPQPNKALAGHFKVLGLPPTADAEDVKRAFRQLALRYHPDKNPGEAQAEAAKAFREVREAYDVLCRQLGVQAA